MKETTTSTDAERFQKEANKYAAYLETFEGRLRIDLAVSYLQDFLPQATRPLCALDVGCGTGAIGVRLARLGLHVTLLDPSQPMLDLAELAAQEAGVADRVALKQGDAAQLPTLFDTRLFDLIVCHNTLEFLDDPEIVVRSFARLMRDSSSILSVLARNREGEVLKAVLLTGDLPAAEETLDSEWGQESLYGGRVRLFTPDTLHALLKSASLQAVAERGVRVFSDYLPPRVSRNDEYKRIFELERKMGSRPEFAAVARYTHCLARRTTPVMEADA